jgi:hypothetical protein
MTAFLNDSGGDLGLGSLDANPHWTVSLVLVVGW